MDPIAALKTLVYTLLTQDSEMVSLCGTVRIDNIWPVADEVMPYIVYGFQGAPVAGLDIMATGTMHIDLFDKDETGTRIAGIRQRVSQLLDGALFDSDDGSFRLRKQLDQEMVEDTRYVWHTTMDFAVRYTREQEISYAAG